MNKKRNTLLDMVLIIMILLITTSIIKIYFKESIANSITIVTAIIGALAIWYQLKKEHDISKAEFIINLNNTFHDNSNIEYIYNKLKLYRDMGDITFSEDDGRIMGDYIMYFEIVNYLLDEKIVTIGMVNKLFANKFFIFTNNPYVQKHQLIYSAINKPIFELYEKWYNYRLINGESMMYPKNALHIKLDEYFNTNDNGRINFNASKIVNYVGK